MALAHGVLLNLVEGPQLVRVGNHNIGGVPSLSWEGEHPTAEGGKQVGGDSWEDLVSVLQIALIFFALLAGKEIGDIYSSYREVSQLSIIFDVREEEIARFVREVIAGGEADLDVGLAFTLPSAWSIEGTVTEVPDYVRRWFISVTLSAVVVQQPEVSEVEVQLWVEGEPMLTETFPFEREKVPYMGLLKRTMALRIDDTERFHKAVQEASERYGGEVEFRFMGQALAHVQFLKVRLPFLTARYPLVKAPHLDYLSSTWTDTDSSPISLIRVGEDTYVSMRLRNPTRVHSIWENVTLAIYRAGSEDPVLTTKKEVGVAAGTTATYVFRLSIEEPGVYHYALEAPGGFSIDEVESPRLRAEAG